MNKIILSLKDLAFIHYFFMRFVYFCNSLKFCNAVKFTKLYYTWANLTVLRCLPVHVHKLNCTVFL